MRKDVRARQAVVDEVARFPLFNGFPSSRPSGTMRAA
jgi:hypothetical protein